MEKNLNIGDIISVEEFNSLKTEVGLYEETSLYPHKGDHSYVLNNGFEFMKEGDGYEYIRKKNIGFTFATPDRKKMKSYYDKRKV